MEPSPHPGGHSITGHDPGLILASLTLTDVIAVPHLIILSIFLGLVNAFDMPTRQAFV